MDDRCLTEPCVALTSLIQEVKDFKAQNGRDHHDFRENMSKYEKEEAVQDVKYQNILDKLNELVLKVNAIEAKPGKRWDSILDKLLLIFIGAVASYLLGQLGLPA